MENKNKLMSFLKILFFPITILYYALLGIKAITIDFFKYVYLTLNYQLSMNGANGTSGEEDIYEKTKNQKKKNNKIYRYSASTLKKLEEEKKALLVDLQNAGASRSKVANVYYFKVRDKINGQIITGTLKGYSKLDVNAFLLNEGYDVYEIKNSKWINFLYMESPIFSSKMSTKDLIFWLTQLSTYLKAGLTLSESIKILGAQMGKNKDRARAFQSISYELTLGENFSDALAKQGSMFPALMINMIKAAEASGTLQETLEDLANYYSEINSTKKEMVSAITYPTVILVFSIGVITFIMLYVIPQFQTIYAQAGAEISGITKFVINLSTFVSTNIIVILIVIVAIVVIFIILYKKVKSFRTSIQVLLMHIPVIKDVIIYNELTIFSKTFASLLRNNVYITESVDILSKITNNEIYKAILFKTINNIIRGEKISDAFKDHWAIPDVAYYMIVTGESTGDLANMMQKVSDYYQEMHRSVVNNLKTFIEPVLISFLAVIVGVIIVAVIVPMFGIYDSIK